MVSCSCCRNCYCYCYCFVTVVLDDVLIDVGHAHVGPAELIDVVVVTIATVAVAVVASHVVAGIAMEETVVVDRSTGGLPIVVAVAVAVRCFKAAVMDAAIL